MGDVPQSPGHCKPDPPPKPNAAMTVMARKLDDLTEKFTQLEEKLHEDQRSWHEKNSQLSCEISYLRTGFNALQNDHSDLQKQHNRLKTEHSKLHQEMTELKVYFQAFQADHSKVLTDQEKLKTEMNNMRPGQQTQPSDAEKLREEQSDILRQVSSLRKEMTSLSHDLSSTKNADIAQLHTELQNLSKLNQTNPSKLHEEMAKLQEDHGKLMTNQNNLETEVKRLQTEQAKLHTDMDTIRTGQKNLYNDISKLQSENVDPVLAEHRQLQQNQATLTSDVDTLRTDVEGMQASLQQSLEKATSSFAALETRLGTVGLLFHVRGFDKDATRQHHATLFSRAVCNEGTHFSMERGVFITPRAGLYLFCTGVASRQKGTTVCSHIMVGADVHCVVQGGVDRGSGTELVRLVAGQEVWVRAASPVGQYSNDRVPSFPYGWYFPCHFSGTLVLPL